VSDDTPIWGAKFSKVRNEIYVLGDQSVKIWNAQSGKPVRVLKNIFSALDNITYIRLDDTHRQIVVGSHLGEIKVYDILSGLMTHQLEGHSKDAGEISFLGYGDGDSTVISVAWDKVIKVHKDEKVDEGLRQGHTATSLRSKGRCHEKDITCADYHHKLGLIATGA